ncbi:MAG TPA: TolC family protein [bacterium]|nr:TolC family protein [bacterium]
MPARFLRRTALVALFLAIIGMAGRAATAETVYLTEQKVIDLALEKNLSVLVAGEDREIGRTGIQGAKSVYDTQLSLTADHLIDKRDQAIPVFGTDNRTTNWNLGLSRAFPTGTRADLNWTNQRNSTNSPFATLNPYYEPAVEMALRQPVLKNTFGKQDRGGVALAKKRFEEIDFLARRRVMEAVYGVLSDYWAWVTHRGNADVTETSVAEARRLEALAAEKKIFGLYETTDVLAARANRMQMENQLTEAIRQRDDALGRLKRGLDFPDEEDARSSDAVPVSAGGGGREDALASAMANRSDYAAARARVEAQKIEVSLARNRKWPQMDLVASLRLNGVDTSYGSSLGEIGGGDHPAYFFGGEFAWPIENRLAKSESRRAEHEKKKALFELKDVENRVAQEVEERWREVQSTRKQVANAREIERVEREKWTLELEKYRVGRSSSDLVIRYQEDYLEARRRALASLFQHRMAVLGLKLAEETLVERHRNGGAARSSDSGGSP